MKINGITFHTVDNISDKQLDTYNNKNIWVLIFETDKLSKLIQFLELLDGSKRKYRIVELENKFIVFRSSYRTF